MLLANMGGPGGAVDLEAPVANNPGLRPTETAPDERANASAKLGDFKRFDQIIIRPSIQTFNPVTGFAQGREDQRPNAVRVRPVAQKIKPVAVLKRSIEHEDIGHLSGHYGRPRCREAVAACAGQALMLKRCEKLCSNTGIIFNNKRAKLGIRCGLHDRRLVASPRRFVQDWSER